MKIAEANATIKRTVSTGDKGQRRARNFFEEVFVSETQLESLLAGGELEKEGAITLRHFQKLEAAVENGEQIMHPYGIPGWDLMPGGGTIIAEHAKPLLVIVEVWYGFQPSNGHIAAHWRMAAKLKLLKLRVPLEKAKKRAADAYAKHAENVARLAKLGMPSPLAGISA